MLHPRRSYFLDVARKRMGDTFDLEVIHSRKRIKTERGAADARDSANLLQNITAAAPMISIREL